MRAPLTGAFLLLALSTSAHAHSSNVPLDLGTSRALALVDAGLDLSALRLIVVTQFEKLDTSKGKFFAGLGLRLGL